MTEKEEKAYIRRVNKKLAIIYEYMFYEDDKVLTHA